ncbi:hypothetical protein ASZ90_004423 [hydrocarbon metagenome]|uniref:Uncharacterized protein n=1 Tax=hydrocarbon metagenome TaxID=938273 RepID=A0A0W8FY15_9ZZZZ
MIIRIVTVMKRKDFFRNASFQLLAILAFTPFDFAAFSNSFQ